MTKNNTSRRLFVKSSLFGLLAASIPNITFAKTITDNSKPLLVDKDSLFYRYPSIDDAIVSDVVGKSHFDLDGVKKLVDKRPELARATWDWGFGDWESAIGAASHVGRRDIVEYLLSKGARPNLFTFAVLGAYKAVTTMVEHNPGIQKIQGPHGISLLSHAKAGLRMKDTMTQDNIAETEKLIAYLEELGDANGETYLEMTDDKQKYLGDYKYGDGEADGFSIKLNMRKMISLGKIGQFGGALLKIADNKYLYNGTTSVIITFQIENNVVKSLTVQEPDLTLVAKKV